MVWIKVKRENGEIGWRGRFMWSDHLWGDKRYLIVFGFSSFDGKFMKEVKDSFSHHLVGAC